MIKWDSFGMFIKWGECYNKVGQLFCVTRQGKWYYKIGQVLRKGQFLLQSGAGVTK